MERKEYQTINGVHVYEITWDTTNNKSNVGNLPVEVDLPFRTSYNDDVINEASIFDGLTALYDCMPTGFKFEYKCLGETKNETEFFKVSYIHRDDLKFKGFDVSNVTDEDMRAIASVMNDVYLDGEFWDDLEYASDKIGVPRTEEEDEE